MLSPRSSFPSSVRRHFSATIPWLKASRSPGPRDGPGRSAYLHPESLALCGHFCPEPIACARRDPKSKGIVEAQVRYVKHNALQGGAEPLTAWQDDQQLGTHGRDEVATLVLCPCSTASSHPDDLPFPPAATGRVSTANGTRSRGRRTRTHPPTPHGLNSAAVPVHPKPGSNSNHESSARRPRAEPGLPPSRTLITQPANLRRHPSTDRNRP